MFHFNPQSVIRFDLFIDVSLFFIGFVKVRSTLSSQRKKTDLKKSMKNVPNSVKLTMRLIYTNVSRNNY